MSKVILVTGAGGFLGRNAARHFAAMGNRVYGLGHASAGAPPLAHGAWLAGDITMANLLALGVKPDLVLHCAGGGSVGYSVSHPAEDFARTVTTTRSVLEFIAEHAPEATLVYPSSAAVYGDCGPEPLREDRPLAPVSPYGEHKRAAEELCAEYSAKHGLNVAVVRMFSLYGRDLRKQLLFDAFRKIRAGENIFFGSGNETRDWLEVSDAVGLMDCAAQQASGLLLVNGGTGVAVRNRELLSEIFRALGRMEEPRFNGQVRPGDPQHYQADTNRAFSLGWRPEVDWRSGVRAYLAWIQGEGL